jgi:ribose transport system substrate-binding protein
LTGLLRARQALGEKRDKIQDTGFYFYDKTNIADPKVPAVLYD